MGETSSKVLVRAFSPSPTVPDGRLSVVSNALDEFVDFDTLWRELVNLMRAPQQMPVYVLTILKFQSSELVEDSDNGFKTVEVYNGIKTIKKHYLDKANRVVIIETFYETEDVLDNKVILVLTKDPMRIECWGEKTERVSHLLRFDTMTRAIIRGIREFGARGRAKVLENVPSRDGSGAESCMTGPLDAFGTAEALFERLVQFNRSAPVRQWALKSEVIDPSETQFTVVEYYPADVIHALFQRPVTGGVSKTLRKCTVDSAQRKLSMEVRLEDGTVVATAFAVIHDSPVQFEFWHLRMDGSRDAGDKAGVAQEMLDGVLGKDGAFAALARPSCPSRVDPDAKSAMSSPSDQLTDYETLWERFRKVAATTVVPPEWAYSQEFIGEDEAQRERSFKLVTRDGGEEVLRKIVTDVENGQINDRFTHKGELRESRWVAMHKDPVQIELWEEHRATEDRFERRSGPFMAIKLQEVLNYLLGFKPPKDIRFDTAESPGNPSLRSVVSDPLDDILEFDFLWDTLMFLACTMEPRDVLKTVEIVDVKPNDFVFRETYHEAFTQTFGRGADFSTFCLLHHEKSRGLITTERQFNNVRFRHTIKIHREPLRLEIWQDYQERRNGDVLRAMCQVYVDEILRRVGKPAATA